MYTPFEGGGPGLRAVVAVSVVETYDDVPVVICDNTADAMCEAAVSLEASNG